MKESIRSAVMQGSNHQYYAALDGVRALCIALTLINHTPGNPGINGSVGVDIFFALSGYLITALLVQEKQRRGKVCVPCFYIRRAFRIIPLYGFTILLYLIGALAAYALAGSDKGLNDWLSAAPWLATFSSEWRPESAGTMFGHAWTLGIEEKYYLLWPLIFTASAVNSRRLAWSMLPLAGCVLFLDQQNIRGYVGIVFGSMLALGVENNGPLKAIIERTPAHVWVGLMAIGYAVATKIGIKLNVLVSIPAAFFISGLIHQPHSFYKTILSHRGLVFLGGLTYGIYLIHPLVQHITNAALERLHIAQFLPLLLAMYAGSVIAAYCLQKLIEAPLIKIGRKLARPQAEYRAV
jgi:peptidoglycan/LPS O-acetylase OafA/YrhL